MVAASNAGLDLTRLAIKSVQYGGTFPIFDPFPVSWDRYEAAVAEGVSFAFEGTTEWTQITAYDATATTISVSDPGAVIRDGIDARLDQYSRSQFEITHWPGNDGVYAVSQADQGDISHASGITTLPVSEPHSDNLTDEGAIPTAATTRFRA